MYYIFQWSLEETSSQPPDVDTCRHISCLLHWYYEGYMTVSCREILLLICTPLTSRHFTLSPSCLLPPPSNTYHARAHTHTNLPKQTKDRSPFIMLEIELVHRAVRAKKWLTLTAVLNWASHFSPQWLPSPGLHASAPATRGPLHEQKPLLPWVGSPRDEDRRTRVHTCSVSNKTKPTRAKI